MLNMYGWIDVNSKFISLRWKLLLSQGTTTALVVPQIWGYPMGDRAGLSNGTGPEGMGLWGRDGGFSPDILNITLSCSIANIKALLCHNGVNFEKKKTIFCGCVSNADCDLLCSLKMWVITL